MTLFLYDVISTLFGRGCRKAANYSVALLCVFCHKAETGMSAGCIMLANYLAHDKIFQSLCLWREEFRKLLGCECLPLYITYYIYHAVAWLCS